MQRNRIGRSSVAVPVWFIALTVILIGARVAVNVFEKKDTGPVAGEIAWITPDKVPDTNEKLLLYDFTAEWCGPCQLMEKTTFLNRTVAQLVKQHYVPIKVVDRQREDGKNTDEVDELQSKYKLYAFPTIVVALTDGTKVDASLGFAAPQQFERFLAKCLETATYTRGRSALFKGRYDVAVQYLAEYQPKISWKQIDIEDVIFVYAAAYKLANKELPATFLEEGRKNLDNDSKTRTILDYLEGKIDETKLMAELKSKPRFRNGAHFAVALSNFHSDDAKCKKELEWLLKEGDKQSEINKLADRMIKTMNEVK